MNRSKRKGLLNEWKSRDLLIAQGYRVTKSGGSFGPWDLIGVKATDAVLVQVKTTSWPRPQEMKAMRDFPAPANFRKLIHRWRHYARRPDVKEIPNGR